MPRVRDLLYRFRPAGAPGAASAAGVPVDSGALLEGELALVFAELAATEHECSLLIEQARQEADIRRARAEEEARRILTGAETRLVEERASAAASALESLAAEAARTVAEAEAVAGLIRRSGSEHLGEYVARIVGDVDRFVDGRSGGGGG